MHHLIQEIRLARIPTESHVHPPETEITHLELPLSSVEQSESKKIAFLTSGGDCSGMNASIRSIVRVAIAKGCEPFAVYEGYQGLVDGGEKIVKFKWEDVSGILHIGGTIIGSARCKDFRERPGRLKAAYNLISRGIDCLIVNGGDGSLTGANLFRNEWKSLIEELVKTNLITSELALKYQDFTIVGMVGSIDNDMVGTELTIGGKFFVDLLFHLNVSNLLANSSLHRIIEAVDSISSTASSHQRAFVIEVMGRHCGWLALMASIATGADWTFIPEQPHHDDWETLMCNTLKRNRQLGKRKAIVIVAEGAIDSKNEPIKCEYVKEILSKRLNLDTRVTTLGHVQRGGTPSAFDRVLGTLQGVKAVEVAITAKKSDEPVVIGFNENKITCQPLMKSVEMTQAVGKAIAEKNFNLAFSLRDPDFRDAFEISNSLSYNENPAVKEQVNYFHMDILTFKSHLLWFSGE